MNITVTAICRNEELLIGPWIKNLFNISSIKDIVLVDTGSTDKTIEIANKFDKVHLTSVTWEDDFSKARNISLRIGKELKNEWILILDIDEFFNNKAKLLIDTIKGEEDAYIFNTMAFWDLDKILINKSCINNNLYEMSPPVWRCSIIRKSCIGSFIGALHETLDIQTNKRKYLGPKVVNLDNLQIESMVSHYSNFKNRVSATINNINFFKIEGEKRIRYRKIQDAVANNKLYTRQWAIENENNEGSLIELGRNQITQLFSYENRILRPVILSDWHPRELEVLVRKIQ